MRFSCANPECSQRLRAPDGSAGKRVRCSACGQPMTVPETDGGADNPFPEWRPGAIIEDLYEVKERLGQGGMGAVWLVRHGNWDLDLAVKTPNARGLAMAGGAERFTTEAETWVNLPFHPNVVQAFYVRKIGEHPHIFAEYCEGGSLADRIANLIYS